MPPNAVTTILEYGTPGLLLIVLGVQIWVSVRVRDLGKALNGMKGPNGVVYKDVFEQLGVRVKTLEDRINAITS